jgi:replicative DNA helicase
MVSELAPGHRLALSKCVPSPENAPRWPDHELILLGQLVGDGSYLNGKPMRYATTSEPTARRCARPPRRWARK